ncbi:hypothetical protein ACFPYJ_11090 [Paenibacillus solisilvae]|uniref:Uncharacterized protein n=1 Tax=Paenibacillus solisilvae TaxID=2486751 RepID=A0ABW0VV24_9BACL
MNPEVDDLQKKLRYKAGRALVLNAPEGYHLGIEEEAGGDASDKYDFV